MPTTTPLTDAIEALTTYSNTVTGASDTTLSEAVATLAAGYGGGGGGVTLLDTITLAQSSRTVNIDLTPYADCDILLLSTSCQLSTSSWIYCAYNTTTPDTSSHRWQGKASTFNSVLCGYLKRLGSQSCDYVFLTNWNYSIIVEQNKSIGNFFINTYEASTNINAGSIFKIYGCKYSDM